MKLKNIQKGAGIALAALLLSVALSTNAKAVVLAPGGGPVAAPVGSFQAGVQTIGAPLGTPLTLGLGSTITGTFGQSVYAVTGAFGGPTSITQDFYYRFTITGGTVTDSSAINFVLAPNTYVTDVSFLDTAAMNLAFAQSGNDPIFATAGLTFAAPDTVTRSLNGLSIGFNFNTNNLTNGETSFVLKVRTDAPLTITGGVLGVIGTGTSSGLVLQPAGVPVPEPTAALFGCALVGTVLFSRKRKSAAVTVA